MQVLACVAETRRLGALLSHRSALVLSSPALSALVDIHVRTPSFAVPAPGPPHIHPALGPPRAAANAAAPGLPVSNWPTATRSSSSSLGFVVVVVVVFLFSAF